MANKEALLVKATSALADQPLRQVFQDGVNYAYEHRDQPYDPDKIQEAFEASKDRYLNGWRK